VRLLFYSLICGANPSILVQLDHRSAHFAQLAHPLARFAPGFGSWMCCFGQNRVKMGWSSSTFAPAHGLQAVEGDRRPALIIFGLIGSKYRGLLFRDLCGCKGKACRFAGIVARRLDRLLCDRFHINGVWCNTGLWCSFQCSFVWSCRRPRAVRVRAAVEGNVIETPIAGDFKPHFRTLVLA
jgi:hypothetical protein